MEELDLKSLVAEVSSRNLSPLERILLGHNGTVQSLLSIIFKTPVEVKVLEQREDTEGIVRRVELLAGEIIAATAQSFIPLEGNGQEVLALVRQQKLGLGQIASFFSISTSRALYDLGANDVEIWRSYIMEGPGLLFKIRETFQRAVFKKLLLEEMRALEEARSGS